MKNWKTTLAGLVAGLPFAIDAIVQAYTAGYFTDKTGWQLFGAVAGSGAGVANIIFTYSL